MHLNCIIQQVWVQVLLIKGLLLKKPAVEEGKFLLMSYKKIKTINRQK